MDDGEINKVLRELIMETTGRSKIDKNKSVPLIVETKSKISEKGADKIASSIVDLRICIKYLLFDLEATRRERSRFKALLRDHLPPDDPNTTNGEM